MKFKVTHTDQAPGAIGPYSQAVKGAGFLFLSGQIGMDPRSGELVSEEVGPQTSQALVNLLAVLRAEGLDFGDVVETTIYLVDMDDFEEVNALYARAMGDNRPARVTVSVDGLPKGAEIEIKMTAVFPRV